MIGISIGDANGVGPEILLRAYQGGKLNEDVVAIGDYSVMAFCNNYLQLGVPILKIKELGNYQPGFLNVLDQNSLNEQDIVIGKMSEKTGYASIKYVETGTRLAMQNKIDALVTLSINKEAHQGYHTGFFRTYRIHRWNMQNLQLHHDAGF